MSIISFTNFCTLHCRPATLRPQLKLTCSYQRCPNSRKKAIKRGLYLWSLKRKERALQMRTNLLGKTLSHIFLLSKIYHNLGLANIEEKNIFHLLTQRRSRRPKVLPILTLLIIIIKMMRMMIVRKKGIFLKSLSNRTIK